jgi:hypothetical protein
VRDLGDYLAGDVGHVEIQIDFSAYPALAPVVAGALNSDPDTLLRDGFRLNDIDIQRELDASDDPPVEDLAEVRAIFTAAGRTFSADDLPAGNDDATASGAAPPAAPGAAPGAAPEGNPLARVRPFTSAFARWAVPAGITMILVLAAGIGMLGGRQWWSRATWAATALAGPALLLAIVAGPVYSAVVAPRIETAIADRQAELLADPGATTALAVRALDAVEAIANAQAGAFALNAAAALILAGLVAAVAVGWHIRDQRRADSPAGVPANLEPFPAPLEDRETSSERDVRAA